MVAGPSTFRREEHLGSTNRQICHSLDQVEVQVQGIRECHKMLVYLSVELKTTSNAKAYYLFDLHLSCPSCKVQSHTVRYDPSNLTGYSLA